MSRIAASTQGQRREVASAVASGVLSSSGMSTRPVGVSTAGAASVGVVEAVATDAVDAAGAVGAVRTTGRVTTAVWSAAARRVMSSGRPSGSPSSSAPSSVSVVVSLSTTGCSSVSVAAEAFPWSTIISRTCTGIAPGSPIGFGRSMSSDAARKAMTNSPASGRRSGSRRPARSRTGARRPSERGTSRSRSVRASSVPWMLSRANGTSPVTASTNTSASEYTSERPSTALPSACSGAEYLAVPSSTPSGSVHVASASARARPKSAIRSLPSSPNSRLAGLMSRCTNPC